MEMEDYTLVHYVQGESITSVRFQQADYAPIQVAATVITLYDHGGFYIANELAFVADARWQ